MISKTSLLTAADGNLALHTFNFAPGERTVFLRALLHNLRSIAAIAPSSATAAAPITRGIDTRTGPVIELDPCTGVFTALIGRLGLKATRIGSTLRNLLPAAVFRIVRHEPSPLAGSC